MSLTILVIRLTLQGWNRGHPQVPSAFDPDSSDFSLRHQIGDGCSDLVRDTAEKLAWRVKTSSIFPII